MKNWKALTKHEQETTLYISTPKGRKQHQHTVKAQASGDMGRVRIDISGFPGHAHLHFYVDEILVETARQQMYPLFRENGDALIAAVKADNANEYAVRDSRGELCETVCAATPEDAFEKSVNADKAYVSETYSTAVLWSPSK